MYILMYSTCMQRKELRSLDRLRLGGAPCLCWPLSNIFKNTFLIYINVFLSHKNKIAKNNFSEIAMLDPQLYLQINGVTKNLKTPLHSFFDEPKYVTEPRKKSNHASSKFQCAMLEMCTFSQVKCFNFRKHVFNLRKCCKHTSRIYKHNNWICREGPGACGVCVWTDEIITIRRTGRHAVCRWVCTIEVTKVRNDKGSKCLTILFGWIKNIGKNIETYQDDVHKNEV